jgi:phage/conjugal plasmid C-4 type zinc finger TraR family protein
MHELDLIAAELLVELDVAARVAQVQGALMGQGSDQCEDCGAVIEAARRRAAPFAVRCVHCQADAERQKGVM